MILLSLNEGYDKKAINILLTLDKVQILYVSGDGVLECASLIASDLVEKRDFNVGKVIPEYRIQLTKKGERLMHEWKSGNQSEAIT